MKKIEFIPDYKISEFPSRYEYIKFLGKGSYGQVDLYREKSSNALRAVKKIFKNKMTNSSQERLKVEAALMKELDHPNLVKLISSFEDDEVLLLVLEYCDMGELYGELEKVGYYNEQSCAKYIKQILLAIAYMDAKGVCHRDLKPENFLLSSVSSVTVHNGGSGGGSYTIEGPILKVADFGLSKKFIGENGEIIPMYTRAGSPLYVARDVLCARSPAECLNPLLEQPSSYTSKVDVWSTGAVGYLLLSGQPPFYGENDAQTLQLICKGRVKLDHIRHCSELAQHFILSCLDPIPTRRMTAIDALKHPWLSGLVPTPQADLDITMVRSIRRFSKAPKLKKMALFNLAHSVLTDDDLSILRDVYTKLDESLTGDLGKDQIKQGLARAGLLEKMPDLDEVIEMLTSVAEQGIVEWTAFVAASLERRVYLREDTLRHAFIQLDKDGDGYLEGPEIDELLQNPKVIHVLSNSPEAMEYLKNRNLALADAKSKNNDNSKVAPPTEDLIEDIDCTLVINDSPPAALEIETYVIPTQHRMILETLPRELSPTLAASSPPRPAGYRMNYQDFKVIMSSRAFDPSQCFTQSQEVGLSLSQNPNSYLMQNSIAASYLEPKQYPGLLHNSESEVISHVPQRESNHIYYSSLEEVPERLKTRPVEKLGTASSMNNEVVDNSPSNNSSATSVSPKNTMMDHPPIPSHATASPISESPYQPSPMVYAQQSQNPADNMMIIETLPINSTLSQQHQTAVMDTISITNSSNVQISSGTENIKCSSGTNVNANPNQVFGNAPRFAQEGANAMRFNPDNLFMDSDYASLVTPHKAMNIMSQEHPTLAIGNTLLQTAIPLFKSNFAGLVISDDPTLPHFQDLSQLDRGANLGTINEDEEDDGDRTPVRKNIEKMNEAADTQYVRDLKQLESEHPMLQQYTQEFHSLTLAGVSADSTLPVEDLTASQNYVKEQLTPKLTSREPPVSSHVGSVTPVLAPLAKPQFHASTLILGPIDPVSMLGRASGSHPRQMSPNRVLTTTPLKRVFHTDHTETLPGTMRPEVLNDGPKTPPSTFMCNPLLSSSVTTGGTRRRIVTKRRREDPPSADSTNNAAAHPNQDQ